MHDQVIHYDRPGLVGEPMRVSEGFSKVTHYDVDEYGEFWSKFERFDNAGNYIETQWIGGRSVK